MVLWRKSFRSFVSYRIAPIITQTFVPFSKTGMKIGLASASPPLHSPRRALRTSSKRSLGVGDQYEELKDLLSDSDGWDEDLHVAPVRVNERKELKSLRDQSGRVAGEFSDADDSIICELLRSRKDSNAKAEKHLAGASTKSSGKPLARSSFSSLASEEIRRPLVESTQQADIYSSEDSRLLLSLLRGNNPHREEQDDVQEALRSAPGTASEAVLEEVECATEQQEERNDTRPLEPLNVENPDRIKSEDTSDVCIIEDAEPVAADSPKIADMSDYRVPENESSRRSCQDNKSLKIIDEQKVVRYADKFTLLTQRNCIPTTQEIENRLKLNPKGKVIVPVRLSREQEDVIRLAEAGHNIFYTGSAGTGKSVLLREMIKVLKEIYGHDQVAVTASTGLAACNIGGVTLHSFAGVGLGTGEVTNIYRKVRRSRKHVKRWESVSALIIDEISMLDGELLDKLDFIAQKIRKNRKPFGNIQLIFCGDFFQLPPVTKDPNSSTKFAFESNVWKEGIDVTIMLTKVFRQQGDSRFIEMLNKMRLGQIDGETEREFKKLSRPLPQDEIIPAELYSTRNEVERANKQRLNRLPGKAHVFHAIDGGVLEDREMKEKLLQNFLAPKELQLKIGAQVMMIKNIDATLVNGSLGKVIDFIDPETYMFYETIVRNPDLPPGALAKLKDNPELLRETWNEFREESENDTPVRQKTTKDAFCRGDPDESVAQLGESIFDFLKDASSDDIETRSNLDRKRELLRQVHESSKGKKRLPLVRFKTSDMSTRTILVEPESWAIEDENEKPLVSRIQLPLMLAWSLSIHKSQGQTLPKVKVDLQRVFEKGQAYVALSRAVSREGLQVLNFDKTRINAHQKVIDFYSTLITVEHAIKKLEAEAGTTSLRKKRKTSTGPSATGISARTKQARSRSRTPAGTSSPSSRIATMLMNKVQGKPLINGQPHEPVDIFTDRKTGAYSHEA
ncbi:hypothetical protein HG536_0C05830 [Torulaspora globosa]|uniref:ATP-dependent DNA helicase PIF1 n=1 Tax=Torulaspora globosa TaxID=48254 RepID=A0A7G3ZFX8_9SACH|nr:uncharacterized protein HG536_0C05830 [Torulaspora globosa]QLL32414.1 hypothetical protein HG536_0C05830 [Torulaspora globosa]